MNIKNEKGIALIMSIGIVAMLAIIGTTFAINMRLEQKASDNYLAGVKAKILAEGGIYNAVMGLRVKAREQAYDTVRDHWYQGYYSTEGRVVSVSDIDVDTRYEIECANSDGLPAPWTDDQWNNRVLRILTGRAAGNAYVIENTVGEPTRDTQPPDTGPAGYEFPYIDFSEGTPDINVYSDGVRTGDLYAIFSYSLATGRISTGGVSGDILTCETTAGSNPGWVVNAWWNKVVRITTAGTAPNRAYVITRNLDNVLISAGVNFSGDGVSAGDTFEVYGVSDLPVDGGTGYETLIIDTGRKININDDLGANADDNTSTFNTRLKYMLNNLAETIDLQDGINDGIPCNGNPITSTSTTGYRIIKNRPTDSYLNLEGLLRNASISQTEFDAIKDYITVTEPDLYLERSMATSGTATTLTDSTKNWTTDEWQDYSVKIIGGTGTGQRRRITTNTPTQLTITPAWTTITPDTTSEYVILPPRMPININTASKEVLIAVLQGIDDGNITPITYAAAEDIALAIINDPNYGRNKSSAGIRTWEEFEELIMHCAGLLFDSSNHTDSNGGSSGSSSTPHSYITPDEAWAIINNCNPNRDKGTLTATAQRTEFSLHGGGNYEIISTGRILDPAGNLKAEKKIKTIANVYKAFYQTTEKQLERAITTKGGTRIAENTTTQPNEAWVGVKGTDTVPAVGTTVDNGDGTWTTTLQPVEGTAIDTRIDEGNPGINYGADTELRAGMDAADKKHRILIKFDLSSPSLSQIIVKEAKLLVMVSSASPTGSNTVEVYQIYNKNGTIDNGDWVESEATWNDYKAATNWGTFGCDNTVSDRRGVYESTDDAGTIGINKDSDDEDPYDAWPLSPPLVQGWIEGTIENNGLLLKNADDTGSLSIEYVTFYSSLSVGNEPKLEITYLPLSPYGLVTSIPHDVRAGANTDGGTVTSPFAASTLTDSTKSWTLRQWIGYEVEIISGKGRGQVRNIAQNTPTVLTVSPDFASTPDATSTYVIRNSLGTISWTEGLVEGGTVSSTSSSTLVDSERTWPTSRWRGYTVNIVSGAGAGQTRIVQNNTSTTLTISPDWSIPLPDATSKYIMRRVEKGSATGSTVSTLVDTTKTWATDQWNGYLIEITSGNGKGQIRTIRATAAPSTLTVSPDWTIIPSSVSPGDSYVIRRSSVQMLTRSAKDSGEATGGTSSTLADTNKSWGSWTNSEVEIISGTGAGQRRTISSNTANTLTITPNWSVTPDTTSVYFIASTREPWKLSPDNVMDFQWDDCEVATNPPWSASLPSITFAANPANAIEGTNCLAVTVGSGVYERNFTNDATSSANLLGISGQVTSPSSSNDLISTGKFTGIDNAWRGYFVEITSGTGVGQKRRIIRDDGPADNDTVYISPDWTTKPDTTSYYVIRGNAVILSFWIRVDFGTVNDSKPGVYLEVDIGNTTPVWNNKPYQIKIDQNATWQQVYLDITNAISSGGVSILNDFDKIRFTTKNGVSGFNEISTYTVYLDDIRLNIYFGDEKGSSVLNPYNRYLLYRALLTTTDTDQTPHLEDVTLTYLPTTQFLYWRELGAGE